MCDKAFKEKNNPHENYDLVSFLGNGVCATAFSDHLLSAEIS